MICYDVVSNSFSYSPPPPPSENIPPPPPPHHHYHHNNSAASPPFYITLSALFWWRVQVVGVPEQWQLSEKEGEKWIEKDHHCHIHHHHHHSHYNNNVCVPLSLLQQIIQENMMIWQHRKRVVCRFLFLLMRLSLFLPFMSSKRGDLFCWVIVHVSEKVWKNVCSKHYRKKFVHPEPEYQKDEQGFTACRILLNWFF